MLQENKTYSLSSLKLAMRHAIVFSPPSGKIKFHLQPNRFSVRPQGAAQKQLKRVRSGPKWQTDFAFCLQSGRHNDKTLFCSINIPSWHCLPVFKGHKAVPWQPDTFPPLPHISSSPWGNLRPPGASVPCPPFVGISPQHTLQLEMFSDHKLPLQCLGGLMSSFADLLALTLGKHFSLCLTLPYSLPFIRSPCFPLCFLPL